MKNVHLIVFIGGAAVAGLVVGNLASRRPAPPEPLPPAGLGTGVAAGPERPFEPPAPEVVAAAPRAPSAPVPAPPPAPAPAPAPSAADRKAVQVGPEDAVAGPPSAPVTIVEFSDFQCPFCSRVVPTLKRIQDEYGERVRRVFKHHPLAFHQDAPLAHQAAVEAQQQGKFWEFKERLFQNQQALKRENLEAHAQALGLDMARFREALDSSRHKAKLDRDTAQAVALGATGTPAFFINGRFLSGAQPFESFKKMIDEELAGVR